MELCALAAVYLVWMSDKTTTIACKVPPELASRLDQIAEIRRVSRSQVVREALEALVDGRVILPLTLPGGGSPHKTRESDIGRAAQERARRDAEGALNRDLGAADVDSSALDLDQVVSRAIRLVAEGR
jgi:hypothetical protein